VESQARASRLLRAAAESAAADDPTRATADSSAADGAARAESDLGARFHTETLYDSRRVRLLTVIDEGNREGLEIAMGMSMPSRRVVRVLNELVAVHGRPSAVRVDNGPEFTAQPFVDWCAEHGVATHYIQPGKPDQNAYIERFNRSYRTEVLNAHLFESIAELRAITSAWLRIYNSERPHDSLGRVPPLTFLPRPSSTGQSPIELSA
jgi:putative transposase